MINPYETLPLVGDDSDGRDGSLLLSMWGIFPIAMSLRQLWHAVENINAIGHFNPNLIWDGILEYSLLATWGLAVLLRSTYRPIIRILRAFAFLPAFSLCFVAVCSIINHLLPGGGFYLPTVIAHDGLGQFLVFHALYTVVFIPFFAYASMMFRDGYVAFQRIDWRSPFA